MRLLTLSYTVAPVQIQQTFTGIPSANDHPSGLKSTQNGWLLHVWRLFPTPHQQVNFTPHTCLIVRLLSLTMAEHFFNHCGGFGIPVGFVQN